MSTASTMAASPGLQRLRPELLLNIATRLVGDSKDVHHSRHLYNLALVCRQLTRIAREAMCINPILESKKVRAMLRSLFVHPELAVKIKTLTIETAQIERDEHQSTNLDWDLWGQCERHIESLPALPFVMNKLKEWLDSGAFITQLLRTLLPTVLPNIKQLYLGGALLKNLPCVQALISNKEFFIDAALDWKPDAEPKWEHEWLLLNMGPKLTALELPVDMWRCHNMYVRMKAPELTRLPRTFPNLRFLSVSYMAIVHIIDVLLVEVGLQSLETLVLTTVVCNCFVESVIPLLLNKYHLPSLLPRLSSVMLYHRSVETHESLYRPIVDEHSVEQLARIGIHVSEYIPECCLRFGDEYHHPWKYTTNELDARQTERHIEYEDYVEPRAWHCRE
jgi:hypothetical protein